MTDPDRYRAGAALAEMAEVIAEQVRRSLLKEHPALAHVQVAVILYTPDMSASGCTDEHEAFSAVIKEIANGDRIPVPVRRAGKDGDA